MVTSNTTHTPMNSSETLVYEQLDKYIDSMREKFRKKCVIKKDVDNDILKCLSLLKGKPVGLFSSRFIYWVKQRFRSNESC